MPKKACAKSKRGAVVSNCEICAEVGGRALNAGGSSVDAMIATLLCEGVIMPQGMGIGGGLIATIYTRAINKVETLTSRETAPRKAHKDMFKGVSKVTGALSAGVPGELYAYWQLHQKFGILPWKELFLPTIELCRKGIRVTKFLADVLRNNRERMLSEESMAEIFVDSKTGDVLREGDTMYRCKLADTLQIIAEEGIGAMYGDGGRIGKMLIKDIQDMGGIMTERDLRCFRARWLEPISTTFCNRYTLYTAPLPSSGPLLIFMLNILDTLYTSDEKVYWQRIVETFKHGFGHRTHLGDAEFEPDAAELAEQLLDIEFAKTIRKLIHDNITYDDLFHYGAEYANEQDSGTANVAVYGANGDAIVVTSTINSHLGAKVRSVSTGIILNDEMDDFSTPGVTNFYGIKPSPANFIKPGKMPLSSQCPSIVFDKNGKIILLVGGSGGSRISTSVLQTIIRYLILNETLNEAINSGRVHHQLTPMSVDVEDSMPRNIVEYLKKCGHSILKHDSKKIFSAVTAIGLKNKEPEPICDHRRYGSAVIVHLR